MEARALRFIAEACAGRLVNAAPDLTVSGVSTDSRQAQPGHLFVALRGETFDGHDYIAQALERGAAAILCENARLASIPSGCPTVAVAETRQALGALAAAYRKNFKIPIVAVAGSNGKTSTKELVASVLSQKFATLRSEASFNNDVGVPLTLLRLQATHQVAVLEAGTNHPGELAPLIGMIQPRYGILTNIGREHLQYFGDLAGVAREEGWLAEMLPADGLFLASGDNEWTEGICARARCPTLKTGFGELNHWRVSSVSVDKLGTKFVVAAPRSCRIVGGQAVSMADYAGEYRIKLLGRHQVANALFAIAVGAELGLSREEIAAGLADCQPAKMRLQSWDLNGVRVLDDAYNANADSMLAALQTLGELPCQGRRVAVLGDMAELGAHSEAAHEEVGRRAAELGVGQLFAVGKMAASTARGARDAGLTRVLEFADVETAAAAVRSFIRCGDLLLLKASRASKLERISDFLRGVAAARKN